jgi:ABC-type phosphate transport system substrate-binding protein
VVLILWFFAPRHAEARDEGSPFLIIVHPRVKGGALARSTVAEAFLKKRTRWDDSAVIHPVDLSGDSSVREEFSHAVIKRSVAAVRSYWQQQIFSGRGVPPPEVGSDEAVVRYVASHPGGIGYVSPQTELKGVRVVEIRD